MSGPIYRRVLSHRWTKSEAEMPQAEREAVLVKFDDRLRQVGGKRLVIIECDAGEALQLWNTLGTEVFPDRQAAEEYQDMLDNLDGIQDIETTADIGTGHDLARWLDVAADD